jgi:hypothetical protein
LKLSGSFSEKEKRRALSPALAVSALATSQALWRVTKRSRTGFFCFVFCFCCGPVWPNRANRKRNAPPPPPPPTAEPVFACISAFLPGQFTMALSNEVAKQAALTILQIVQIYGP